MDDWKEIEDWIASLPSGPEVVKFPCPKCSRVYRKEKVLARHIKRHHARDLNFSSHL